MLLFPEGFSSVTDRVEPRESCFSRLARVFLKGFAGIPEIDWRAFWDSPASAWVFRRVLSSSVPDPAPSESAPNGSSGDSLSTFPEGGRSGGGEKGSLCEES